MRKKLIEVALPLEAINAAATRENFIYRGNPSAIHKWWAQRPLAACRAVLFASLVDDPDSDPDYRRPDGTVEQDRADAKRADLFDLIVQLVKWENSNNPRVIEKARAEIARCVASRKIETRELAKDVVVFGPRKGQSHPRGPVSGEGVTAWEVVCRLAAPEVVNAFLAEHAPPVLDPFCGGGSIPLEAQRLGLIAHASDLNPVAVLITKALIEIPPKVAGRPPVNPEARKKSLTTYQGAAGLAKDVRYYGKWMRDQAEKRIGHLYPKVKITADMSGSRPDLKACAGQELTVIAWLWARTVVSPNPAARGAHVPLLRSFWLSTKSARKAWLEPIPDRSGMTYRFEVRTGPGEPHQGTISRTGGVCLLTGCPIPLDYIRTEGKAGRLGVRLLAIVAKGRNGRLYLPPTEDHERTAECAEPDDVSDTELPSEALGFRVQNYGMTKHRNLFTSRQLVVMMTLCGLIREARAMVFRDSAGDQPYADAVATYLAFALDKTAEYNCSLVPWYTKEDRPKGLFARQAVPIVWDYAEVNPLTDIGGSLEKSVAIIADVLDNVPSGVLLGAVAQRSATDTPRERTALLSTDPPYYDNVPYADLSDFFYVWLRQTLQAAYPDLLTTLLVPKGEELIADPFRHGGRSEAREFFERGMSRVFAAMRDVTDKGYPATIYYAFKQTEDDGEEDEGSGESGARASTGWETFLQGLRDTGWQISGTWPLRTERTGRIRDIASNALASSIVLVCRPRPAEAPLATRKQFITALRAELPEALRNLQRGNIAPVDLAQAAIGPGMAVFTRYVKVVESDGSPMRVRTALQFINQALDEVLAEQEGEFDAGTRWALAWFDQYGMDEGPYGVAETLSKAKNTAVGALADAGLVTARGGKVRLVKRDELPDGWDPAADNRLTIWEATQHLIRALDKEGESGASALLRKLGGTAEVARDLAYRLYTVCERKKRADEALAYNGLVIAWPELTKLAQSVASAPSPTQQSFAD
jgi:putative DNA methylase